MKNVKSNRIFFFSPHQTRSPGSKAGSTVAIPWQQVEGGGAIVLHAGTESRRAVLPFLKELVTASGLLKIQL